MIHMTLKYRAIKIVLVTVICLLLCSCGSDTDNETESESLVKASIIEKSKVKHDLLLLFGIHDNKTYNKARESLRYESDALREFFSYNYFDGESHTQGNLNLSVEDLSVDYDVDLLSKTVVYSATIYNATEYTTYFTIVTYTDGCITDVKYTKIW